MTYGTIKVDTVTFTNDGVDKSVTLSGLVQNPTFSGNVTVTGTLSGVTVTGTTANFTSGNFTNISGGTHTITSGVFAAGSAASPSITFTGDLNTGIYSPGADQVAISTGGSGRLFVDASGNVKVGSTDNSNAGSQYITVGAPGSAIGGLQLWSTTTGQSYVQFGDGTASADQYRGYMAYLHADDALTFGTASSERLRITSAGLVGVGTSSPSYTLDVAGTNARLKNASGSVEFVLSRNSNSAGASISLNTGDTNKWFFGLRGLVDDKFYFYNNVAGNTALTIDESSRLGVGTTSPGSLLHAAGKIRFGSNASYYGEIDHDAGATGSNIYDHSDSGGHIFRNGGTERLRIDSSGRVGIGTSSPGTVLHCAINSSATSIAAAPGTAFFQNLNATSGAINNLLFVNSGGFGSAAIYTTQTQTGNSGDNLVLNTKSSGGAWNTGVVIDTAGRLGIGTTAVSSRLHVLNLSGGSSTAEVSTVERDNSGYFLKLYRNAGSGNTGGLIGADSAGTYYTGGHNTQNMIYIDAGNGVMQFYTNNAERARIDSSGRLLVGTSSARGYGDGNIPFVQVERATIGGDIANIGVCNNGDNGAGPKFTLAKSRSGSNGGVTVVQNGDSLGSIQWSGADGTDIESVAAQITCNVDGTPGANDMPGRLVFSTTADGASSPTERLRITSAGLVGIGTSSPSATTKMSIVDSTSAGIYLLRTAQGETVIENTGPLTIRQSSGNGANQNIFFKTGASVGTEVTAMTIDGSQRVGIGTASPSATLQVSPSSGSANFQVSRGSKGLQINQDNDSADPNINTIGATALRFLRDGGESMRIDTSGRLLVGTSTAQGTSIIQAVGNSTASTDPGDIRVIRGLNVSSIGANVGAELGIIKFGALENSVCAQISAVCDANWSANDTPGRLVFSTTADGASSPTERMRITNGGYFKASNTGVYTDSAGGSRVASSQHFFRNDANALNVQATSMSTGAAVEGFTSDFVTGATGKHFIGAVDLVRTFIVDANGNVTNTNNSYGAISDVKLKENIIDANSQWDDLKALRVCNYNFKTGESTHTQIGLIAQEVELVSPGLVSESPDLDADGNELGTVTKSVNYSVLYMKAVKALQEAMERIETLEAKVAALETP